MTAHMYRFSQGSFDLILFSTKQKLYPLKLLVNYRRFLTDTLPTRYIGAVYCPFVSITLKIVANLLIMSVWCNKPVLRLWHLPNHLSWLLYHTDRSSANNNCLLIDGYWLKKVRQSRNKIKKRCIFAIWTKDTKKNTTQLSRTIGGIPHAGWRSWIW